MTSVVFAMAFVVVVIPDYASESVNKSAVWLFVNKTPSNVSAVICLDWDLSRYHRIKLIKIEISFLKSDMSITGKAKKCEYNWYCQ